MNRVSPELAGWGGSFRLAVMWLEGQDEYQWAKFNLDEDIKAIYEGGVLDSGWRVQLIENNFYYTCLFQSNGAWAQALQQAGKFAATARSLYVALGCAKEGEPALDRLNALSFTELERAIAPDFSDGRYMEATDDIWSLPVGGLIKQLHESLPRPFDPSALGDEQLGLARAVYFEAVRFMIDKIDASKAATGELLLPKPGVSSGNITPWEPGAAA